MNTRQKLLDAGVAAARAEGFYVMTTKHVGSAAKMSAKNLNHVFLDWDDYRHQLAQYVVAEGLADVMIDIGLGKDEKYSSYVPEEVLNALLIAFARR